MKIVSTVISAVVGVNWMLLLLVDLYWGTFRFEILHVYDLIETYLGILFASLTILFLKVGFHISFVFLVDYIYRGHLLVL